MRIYHKIQSVFKRDPDNHYKTFLFDQYTTEAFSYLRNNQWQATEKIDGTNTRICVGDGVFAVGGRTDNAQLHPDLVIYLTDVAKSAVLADLDGLTLFGEGYGAGIQKGGGDYRPDKGFILFDVQVEDSGLWLERRDVIDIADKIGVPIVSQVWQGTLVDAVEVFSNPQLFIKSNEREAEAEGWVLRPATELIDRRGSRIVTKIKTKDFPERTG